MCFFTNMKIISWNINGIRALYKKGIDPFLDKYSPDILCFQEIKADESQVQIPKSLEDMHSYYNSAEKKGYSGVALYSKIKPESVSYLIGDNKFENEGRLICAKYKDFILYNIYFPNGQRDEERLKYKLNFYKIIIKKLKKHQENNDNIIILGDYNTAHTPIDLSNPQSNKNTSGFLDIERKLIDKIIDIGYDDTLRLFHKEDQLYTWWSPITRARERNVGWRIDYIFTSKNIRKKIKSADILSEIYGSDHCPISIDIEF